MNLPTDGHFRTGPLFIDVIEGKIIAITAVGQFVINSPEDAMAVFFRHMSANLNRFEPPKTTIMQKKPTPSFFDIDLEL